MAKQTDTRQALLAGQPQPAVGIPVAPAAQVMARNWQEVMASTPGLLLRERISLMQFLCGACEKRTSYAVGAYPMQDGADVHVHLDDTAFLTSLNTQGLFQASKCSLKFALKAIATLARSIQKSKEVSASTKA